ncbi:hypothetical protein XM25_00720 [Devosia sp. H5989]|nr:hypothetical protein XM25_00720 [Devosia sp. H5989]
MAKTVAERSAEWRRRLLLKSTIFDDLNAERAARIRQAFPGDERPEVRAVVEFFANYPRCQHAPRVVELSNGVWSVYLSDKGANLFEVAASEMALSEVTSLPVLVADVSRMDLSILRLVRDEVAEMRALGLWGRS